MEHHDTIADSETINPAANCSYNARGFVSENSGRRV
jgi:hypothetical protein